MPRPDVSEERIGQIIEASLIVFAREGFAQARMDDIAKEAGLSKAALYLYFKGKDAIITAILKVFFRQEMRFVHTYQISDVSIAEQLLRLIRQVVGAVERIQTLMPIVFEFYAIAGRQQEVRQLLTESFNECMAFFENIVSTGIKRGEFKAVDPHSTALAILALYEGLMFIWITDSAHVDKALQAENAMRLLIQGMS
jgi:AcrR family transcriptional regulator